MVMRFAEKPVFRILVNTASSQGGTGVSTSLSPSFTLGCGTWGGSATSDNVTPMHLINIKRVAYGIKDCAPSPAPVATCCRGYAEPGYDEPGNVSESQLLSFVNELVSMMKKNGEL